MSTKGSLDPVGESSYLEIAYNSLKETLTPFLNYGSDNELTDFAQHYINEYKFANDEKTPHTQEQLDKVVEKHLEE